MIQYRRTSGTPGIQGERGSISLFVVVLAVAFLVTAGLALDGGRKLAALSEARDLADNAARAGAQAVDVDLMRMTGQPALDPTAAAAAASAYLASVGHHLDTPPVVTETTITVTVELQVNTVFLPPMSARASETADAVYGITEGLP